MVLDSTKRKQFSFGTFIFQKGPLFYGRRQHHVLHFVLLLHKTCNEVKCKVDYVLYKFKQIKKSNKYTYMY